MSIYDSLLQIPLFKGLSVEQFNEIVGKFRVEFLLYNKGEVIVNCNDDCNNIRFIVSGAIKSELASMNKKIKLLETVPAPNVIFPNYLFGDNRYPATIKAAENETSIMVISKQDFLSIIESYRIVMLNYLIYLSRKSQQPFEAYKNLSADNFRCKFAYWILSHTHDKATEIVIQSKYRDIYPFFGVQRGFFNTIIEEMKNEGILDYSTKAITIPDRNRVRLYFKEHIPKEEV